MQFALPHYLNITGTAECKAVGLLGRLEGKEVFFWCIQVIKYLEIRDLCFQVL